MKINRDNPQCKMKHLVYGTRIEFPSYFASYTGGPFLLWGLLEQCAKSDAKNIWSETHCNLCQRSNVKPKDFNGLIYPLLSHCLR